MSTVIAFPVPKDLPQRHGSGAPKDAGSAARPEGAEIVILPVVRIERYETPLPGPAPFPTGIARRF